MASSTSSTNDRSASRTSYGGPKIKKVKSIVPLNEKQKQGKSLDLSLKATSQILDVLPNTFKSDDPSIEELRKLDLTGQTKLFKHGGLGRLRFVGGTLTWLNLSGVDCGNAAQMDWLFLKMMQTLFVLTMMNCNLEELPKEIADVKSLKALVASHNNLTSPSLSRLSSLKSLNSLILSDNQLTSFPSSTLDSLTSLKKISLANNKLTSDTLPSFASISSTLEELRLNGNAGITEVPELVQEGDESSSILTVLELSHTDIKDLKEIKKLQKLPKLVNLGLRDTPISRLDDYRTKITEMLPNLRILDNVRFDPLYLARKAKGNDPETEAPRRGKGKGMLQKSDRGWGSKVEGKSSDDVKGKKRQLDDDRESVMDGKGKARQVEEEQPVHVPARKRSKKSKKSQETLEKDDSASAKPARIPKSVGGSLSGPKAATEGAGEAAASTSVSESTGDTVITSKSGKEGLDLKQVPKQVSSVVGVVEVVASTKKAKERPHRYSKQGRKGGQEEISATDKPDVLTLLAQEREKAATVGGWD